MTERPLAGRAALITGASRGLGLEIAGAFVKAGAGVFLCARSRDLLDQAKEQLQRECPSAEVEVARADVSQQDEVASIVRASLERFPDLDILVNNAGIYGPMGPLEEVDWSSWVQAVAVNLYGSALTIRALLPHLKKRRYGKIIQLSGGGATQPFPYISAYGVSKAAIVRLIESIAEECRPFGIDANSIAPGAVNTAMLDEVLRAGPEAVGREYFEKSVKQKASGGADPSQGAALAVFLASRESDGITGRLISALWDRYTEWPARLPELSASDAYTLRRITGRDRGFDWGDR
jgi:NAD(P)-dependent dehydrogenase (short-subunit alcohol dehydrogenase family)